jgi:hypothetical protein
MQHLLAGYVEEHPAPPLDDLELILPNAWTCSALQAERGVEVFTHHGVLKLSSLTEKIGQLLAILHHDGRLSPHRKKGIDGGGCGQRRVLEQMLAGGD